jgi:uncharacterized membrane protein YgcG
MSSRLLAIALALVALAPAVARAQADVPPRPERWVADEAKLLTAEERSKLEVFSDSAYASQGVRLAVLTLADAKGEAPKAIAVRALNSWDPGPRSVLLLVVMNPRKIYIQPGTDLAPKLGETECSSICSGQIAPHLKAQMHAAGLNAGLEAIRDAIVALPAEAPAPAPRSASAPTAPPSARGSAGQDIGDKIFGWICSLICMGVVTAPIVVITRLLRRPAVCPQCRQRTVTVSNRTLTEADDMSRGQGERTKKCPCGWTTVELYMIPMLVRTTSYDSSSSSSFDSGSSSSSSSSDGSGGGGSDF